MKTQYLVPELIIHQVEGKGNRQNWSFNDSNFTFAGNKIRKEQILTEKRRIWKNHRAEKKTYEIFL